MYDATNLNQTALYRWKSGEPNNLNNVEDCVHIFARSGQISLNDYECDKDYYKYDSKPPMYGLCEIVSYKCIPSL